MGLASRKNRHKESAVLRLKDVRERMPDVNPGDFTRPATYYKDLRTEASDRARHRIFSNRGLYHEIDRNALRARQQSGNEDLKRARIALGERSASDEYALGLAREAALGRMPSAAEAQLLMGRDQLARDQLQMAAGVRGNPIAAMRNAMRANRQNALTTNQQAALLRAEEMALGRSQLMQAEQADMNQRLAIAAQQRATGQMMADTASQGIAQKLAAEQFLNQLDAQDYQAMMNIITAGLQGSDAASRRYGIKAGLVGQEAGIKASQSTGVDLAKGGFDFLANVGSSVAKGFAGA